jgi:hypothetical protein
MKICSLLLLPFLLLHSNSIAAEEELTIERSVTVKYPTHEGAFYELQSSTNLNEWASIQESRGTGGLVGLTIPSTNHTVLRVLKEEYPGLAGLEITAGGSAMTPAFRPDRYLYSFKRGTNSTAEVTLTFETNVVEATIQGSAVVSGESAEVTLNDFADVVITLRKESGLVTDYILRPVPEKFPTITITNFAAADRDSVVLLGARFVNNAFGSWVMVMDNDGVPLWWREIDLGLNFRKHENGLFSYVQYAGTIDGQMHSKNIVMDAALQNVMEIRPPGDFINDLHDFKFTKRGTYYTMSYQWRTNELQLPGGGTTNVYVKDNFVHEVRTSDGAVLFEWGTWGNLSYLDSKYNNPADYAHLNWVAEDFDENVLISTRGLGQVVKVRKADGQIVWRLGRDGDFEFVNDPLNGFGGQHAAHRLLNGNILIFDNRNFISTNAVLASEGPSRAVEYRLDEQEKTATLVWSYSRPGFHSTSEGAVDRLENGNTFISWGKSTPVFATEVTAAGEVVQDIRVLDHLGRDMLGYHSYKVKKGQVPVITGVPVGGPRQRM